MLYTDIKQMIEKVVKQMKLKAELERSKGDGFFALPLYREKDSVNLAKKLEKEFPELPYIEKIEAKGPYLNFYLDHFQLLGLEDPLPIEKKTVMIEFSSPNTNKPLHLGHLRNDFLGMFLSRLFEKFGNKVIKANLFNDKGLAIAKTIVAYKHNPGTPEEFGLKSDHYVGYLYTLYQKDYETNKELEKEAKEVLRKFEEDDKEIMEIWEKIIRWATDGYYQTYKRIGSDFDIIYRESKLYKKSKEIVEEGLAKGVFKKEGAIKAILHPQLPDKIILREDGTSLYITTDLYLTKIKFQDYQLDKHYWVVASEQNLYFKQLIAILKKLGYSFAKDKLEHISYGLVHLPEGRMKSREGNVIDADELLDKVKEIAEKELDKRKAPLERAEAICISAVKFALLKTDKNKDITYHPEDSLRFEGETGPYLLYTYARAKSILRKTNKKPFLKKCKIGKERKLLDLFIDYNNVLCECKELKSPHPLTKYLISLAEEFNSFYHSEKILGSEREEFLLFVVRTASEILKDGLYLLGIKVLEEM